MRMELQSIHKQDIMIKMKNINKVIVLYGARQAGKTILKCVVENYLLTK